MQVQNTYIIYAQDIKVYMYTFTVHVIKNLTDNFSIFNLTVNRLTE